MTETTTRSRDRRASRKLQTFRRIQEEAMRLFLAQGFDNTTVEEVAAAAGVSHMTIYRHFPTKEALVLTDEWDLLVPDAIRNRPPDEGPLDAVEGAFLDMLGSVTDADIEMITKRLSLTLSDPRLQAASLFNSLETIRVVALALRGRGIENDDILHVVASTAIMLGGMAAIDWVKGDRQASLEQLVRRRFAALREVVAGSARPAPADGAP